jgi:hypothetical protein
MKIMYHLILPNGSHQSEALVYNANVRVRAPSFESLVGHLARLNRTMTKQEVRNELAALDIESARAQKPEEDDTL